MQSQIARDREAEFHELMKRLSPENFQMVYYMLMHPELFDEFETLNNDAKRKSFMDKVRKAALAMKGGVR